MNFFSDPAGRGGDTACDIIQHDNQVLQWKCASFPDEEGPPRLVEGGAGKMFPWLPSYGLLLEKSSDVLPVRLSTV